MPLYLEGSSERQRDRHFRRRRKVFGQFFTPPRLATWVVETALPLLRRRESMLDPACGDGAFLEPACSLGFREIVGIEVDPEVWAAAGRRLEGTPGVSLRLGDALDWVEELEGRFDLVATNPPFSAKYGRVKEASKLQRFTLGAGRRSEAVEALFLELCVRALREGGVLAVVLPEGLFANLPYRRVREWLLRHVRPLAVISLSRRFFPAKSCVLIACKEPADPSRAVFLAHVEDEEDLSRVSRQLQEGSGLWKPVEALIDDMAPLHHLTPLAWPTVFPLRPLKELLWEIRGGHAKYGAQRRFAGSGIPFLSAKTVTPFGIDPRRDGRYIAPGSPMDHPGARVRKGDVLFVRVGVGCIGRAAAVLEEDEEGLADDYIYIIRLRTDMMRPEFFALLTQTAFFQQALRRIWRGTGTVTVPQRLLRELWIPVPPLPAQEPFVAAYRALHRRAREGLAGMEELQAIIARLEAMLEGSDDAPGVRSGSLGSSNEAHSL
ncbi:N-6 DNA methylase [Thermoflexus sp.]|uniref:N-6 DNA methylase n=1 Tax=Thermoflexus sp. TaxID=1969742 RepID=UPI002ADE18BB|nr:N-6 DNA methylase [Thermoflexus sp.]